MAGATDADWVVKLIDVFPADEPSALAMRPQRDGSWAGAWAAGAACSGLNPTMTCPPGA